MKPGPTKLTHELSGRAANPPARNRDAQLKATQKSQPSRRKARPARTPMTRHQPDKTRETD